MFKSVSATESRRGSLLFFLLAFGTAGMFAVMPLDVMLGHFIIDDMFYYLKIAQHIVSGDGSTFDGTEPTNGYHPGWMLISVAFASFLQGEALMRAVLLTAAALFGLQATLIWRILSRHCSLGVAAGVTLLVILNWRSIAITLGGLETPLAGAAVLLVLDYCDRHSAAPWDWRTRAWATVLLALAFYARVDLLLLVGSTLFWVLARDLLVWRTGAVRALAGVEVMTAGWLVLTAPWFVFSWITSQAFLPNSRVAWSLLREMSLAAPTWGGEVLNQIRTSMSYLPDLANLLGLWPVAAAGGALVLVPVGLLGLAFAALAWMLVRHRAAVPPMMWLALGFGALVLGYYILLHSPRVRYLYLAVLALAPVAAVALDQARANGAGARRAVPALLVVLFAMSSVAGIDAWRKYQGSDHFHRYHPVLLQAALWLRDNGGGAPVGAWNGGILSYFSGAPVTNLDGVVNDAAIAAEEDQTTDLYIRARGLKYLADVDTERARYLRTFGSGTDVVGDVVARFPLSPQSAVEIVAVRP